MNHSERAHALLSPSSSSMWLHCPPSARLNDGIEETGDRTAAERGTLGHELAELELRMQLGLIQQPESGERYDELTAHRLYDKRLHDDANHCVKYALQRIAYAQMMYGEEVLVIIEERVHYDRWVPEGFGSADLIIVTPGYVEVMDWKFGSIPVVAENNSQLRIYGAACLDKYGEKYGSPLVRTTIMQPAVREEPSIEELSSTMLLSWMEEYVQPRAALAWAGQGQFAPGEKTCQWCKVKATCRARAEKRLAEAQDEFESIDLLDDYEVAELFKRVDGVRQWCNDVENYVHQRMASPDPLPLLKVVEGRSVRAISDATQARERLLLAGFAPEQIDAPMPTKPDLLGITALEKLMGKKAFESVLDGLVYRVPGRRLVVDQDDPRAPINVSPSNPDEDFSNL